MTYTLLLKHLCWVEIHPVSVLSNNKILDHTQAVHPQVDHTSTQTSIEGIVFLGKRPGVPQVLRHVGKILKTPSDVSMAGNRGLLPTAGTNL